MINDDDASILHGYTRKDTRTQRYKGHEFDFLGSRGAVLTYLSYRI